MRPRPGGHLDPPQSSSITEVMSNRDPVQIGGPVYFRQTWVSSETYRGTPSSSFMSPELQIEPSFQTALGSQVSERSRRNYRRVNERIQPYRLNERTRRKDLPREDLVRSQAPCGNVGEIGPSMVSRKRFHQHRVTYVCTYNEPIQVHNTSDVGNIEISETQMSANVETHENQTLFQTEEAPVLTSNYLTATDNNPTSGIYSATTRSSSGVSEPLTIPLVSTNSRAVSNIPNCVSISPVRDSARACSFSSDHEMNRNYFNKESSNCHLRRLQFFKNMNCGYSNHDRSSEDFSLDSFSQNNDLNISPIISFRLDALSMLTVPPPTAHARQVANRVIKHARYNKTPNESSMWCPNCGLFPDLPVTGQCGHTRCTKCIQDHGSCPCGTQAPKNLHVNTLIQDLIRKWVPNDPSLRMGADDSTIQREPSSVVCNRSLLSSATRHVSRWCGLRPRHASSCQRVVLRPTTRLCMTDFPPHTPMSPQSRFSHARQLMSLGRYREAAPHLARVAASSQPALTPAARSMLIQTITELSRYSDLRRLTRELYRSVRLQAAATWLQPADLECVLCYHTYTKPVTTPCGHTYCRTCIERSMDYKKSCALCLRPLDNFNLAVTRETVFICAALASIDALNPPSALDPDVIPIFVCTVAYPAIPCPLFIFDPRYWLMIRRVLESGSRKFGMVAYGRDRTYSDYGTVLEVCDCVQLEDGRSILSTVGVSRFKVIERDVMDGCDVARIQPLTDTTPTEELVIWDLRIMATQILYKALIWLNGMNTTVRSEIETAFGQLPHFDYGEADWWESPDGPPWLWWLIAILPLRSEIKVLILSTKSLLKRMMAVSRTLEVLDHVHLTASTSSECVLQSALNNAEEWLERGT